MQGDFDRVTFDRADAFANVLLQQGRLLMPADFNELGAILQDAMRQYIIDAHGKEWQVDGGFTVAVTGGSTLTFSIKGGRFYVDGMRCETTDMAYGDAQPFWLHPSDLNGLQGDQAIVYLHCWERHVSWLQNDKLRDVALGGPDTATRVQIAWQVRAESTALVDELQGIRGALKEQSDDGGDKTRLGARMKRLDELALFGSGMTLNDADEILNEIDDSEQALMFVDADEGAPNADPCAIASDAAYRGRENQLYRIEVHQPGTSNEATIKWSRENGSVAFRVLEVITKDEDKDRGKDEDAQTRVTLESLGHDRRTGVFAGDWVELIDDDLEFGWAVPTLLQVKSVDVQRRVVTLTGAAKPVVDPDRHALLRRWDHRATNKATGTVALANASWIELERGIKVKFTKGAFFRRRDYWQVVARVGARPDWPRDHDGKPLGMKPHGPTHHRAVLALVTKAGGPGGPAGTWREIKT